jgi:hypothetical protein
LSALSVTLVVLIRGVLKQVPICGNKELLGLLQTTGLLELVTHVDVGIGEHEVCREKLDGVLSEDLVADHLGHLVVYETVSLLIASLDDQSLRCLHCLVDVDFLALIRA